MWLNHDVGQWTKNAKNALKNKIKCLRRSEKSSQKIIIYLYYKTNAV